MKHRKYAPVYRVALVRESSRKMPEVDSGDVAARLLLDYLSGADREHFVVLMLDCRMRVIGLNTVSVGALTQTIVSPRDVFKPALLSNACYIIVAHNHPSGSLDPSPEDWVVTHRLVDVGKALDVRVLDHIILGDGGYRSLFRENPRAFKLDKD